MVKQFLVVLLVVNVEAFPDVATYNHTAKSYLLKLFQIVNLNPSEGIYMFVDEPLLASL